MAGPSIFRRDGQAVVEFTFGFLIFFSLFMAIVEFSHLLYSKVTLQHALRTAGRYMVTGKTGTDGSGVAIPRDQMIHDIFCANVIAAGVQCPSIGERVIFSSSVWAAWLHPTRRRVKPNRCGYGQSD